MRLFLAQSGVFSFSLTWILVTLFMGTGVGVAQYENYQEQVPGSDAILPMVYIEAGTFKMGSPKSEKGHLEMRAHSTPLLLTVFGWDNLKSLGIYIIFL